MALDKPALIKFIIFLVLIAAVVYIFRYSPLSSRLTVENIKNFVESFGFFSFLAFVFVYALGTVVSIPGVIITFIGAVLFGTFLGMLLNVVGATIGAIGASYS